MYYKYKQPGALLLDQYQQFEDREPIEYEDIFKQDKELLATVINFYILKIIIICYIGCS